MTAVQYPRLTSIVLDLSTDNGLPRRPEEEWNWPTEAAEMEGYAELLTDDQLPVFAHGDREDVEALIGDDERLLKLDGFCDDIFDGKYTHRFYCV